MTVERDWFWFWIWFYYALWLASVFTLVLVLRQSSENRSNKAFTCLLLSHTEYTKSKPKLYLRNVPSLSPSLLHSMSCSCRICSISVSSCCPGISVLDSCCFGVSRFVVCCFFCVMVSLSCFAGSFLSCLEVSFFSCLGDPCLSSLCGVSCFLLTWFSFLSALCSH